jgi:hypothetical protein
MSVESIRNRRKEEDHFKIALENEALKALYREYSV